MAHLPPPPGSGITAYNNYWFQSGGKLCSQHTSTYMFVPICFENVPPGLIRTYKLLLKVAKSEKIVGCSSYLQTIEGNNCQLSIVNKFADQKKDIHMYIIWNTYVCVFWGFANYKYIIFTANTILQRHFLLLSHELYNFFLSRPATKSAQRIQYFFISFGVWQEMQVVFQEGAKNIKRCHHPMIRHLTLTWAFSKQCSSSKSKVF